MRKFKRVFFSWFDLAVEWTIIQTIVFIDHWDMITLGIRWIRWEGYVGIEFDLDDNY